MDLFVPYAGIRASRCVYSTIKKVSSIPIKEIVFLTKDDLILIKNVINKNRKENKL